MAQDNSQETLLLQRLKDRQAVFQDTKEPEYLETLIASYRQLLRKGQCPAVQGKRDLVGNLFPWHARVAVQELLLYALAMKESGEDVRVRHLTGTANNFVYGSDTGKLVRQVLSAGIKYECVVTHKAFEKSKNELAKILKEFSGLADIRRAEIGNVRHFLLVGECAYRIEMELHSDGLDMALDFSSFEPKVPAAISFNDEAFGKKMAELFDAIWKRSEMI